MRDQGWADNSVITGRPKFTTAPIRLYTTLHPKSDSAPVLPTQTLKLREFIQHDHFYL